MATSRAPSDPAVKRLAEWPLPQVITAAFAWCLFAFGIALLTPPGRFLVWLWGAIQAGQEPAAEDFPVAALKAWFIIVPLVAFGPAGALFVAWLRARGVRGA